MIPETGAQMSLSKRVRWAFLENDGLLSKFEFEGETKEVTAEEKLLLREARKRAKLQ